MRNFNEQLSKKLLLGDTKIDLAQGEKTYSD